MKKLVVAVAIATMAIMSQASVCAWKYSSSVNVAGLDGAKAYIILGSYAGTKTFENLQEITALSYNGATGYATTTATKPVWGNSASGTIDSASLTKDTPSLYLVLVNSDQSGYSVSAVQNATSYLYEAGGSKPGTLTIKPTVAFTNFSTGDVPEPTSAMLLLLGVAGLALRRKQA